MDNAEAIKRIEDHIRVHHIGEYPHIKIAEALKMAISSLANDKNVGCKVEVVRCKDCKHYDNSEGIQWCHLNSKFYPGGFDWHCFPEDGFCSYGERKDNAV